VAAVEPAGEVAEKSGTFCTGQADIEELRYLRTDTGDRTLDFLGDCQINVHFQCLAYLAINHEPVRMDFSGCRFAALHRRPDAVAPLPLAEVSDDENSTLRRHVL
jgi:hypothetical protein